MLLQGYFCKVNKYGRLKFRYLGGSGGFIGGSTDKTQEKLQSTAEHNLGEIYREYVQKQLLGDYNSSDECSDTQCADNNECGECADKIECSETQCNDNNESNDNTQSTDKIECIEGIGDDNSSDNKTSAHPSPDNKPSLHLPFDDRGFTVVLPKWIKNPPADIVSRVGLVCTVEVKAVKYNFTSKAKHNEGANIVGMQLVLVKVRKQ